MLCIRCCVCVCVSSWAAGDQLVDILSGMRYVSVRMLQVKWFISSIRRANCLMCTIWLLDCLQWGAKTNGIDQMKWNHFLKLFTAIDSVAIEWRRRKHFLMECRCVNHTHVGESVCVFDCHKDWCDMSYRIEINAADGHAHLICIFQFLLLRRCHLLLLSSFIFEAESEKIEEKK